ncbi:hypothetical protein [Aquimarina pacifica]|uniref:hypothetical protein n=1 Tax=Aquimarina pacifica TaxID=1296415 RepID=UPI0004B8CC7A|nr:hypothetical protein [Aquimarina pacifica]
MKNVKNVFILFLFIVSVQSCVSDDIEEDMYIEVVEDEEVANDEDNVDIDNEKDD